IVLLLSNLFRIDEEAFAGAVGVFLGGALFPAGGRVGEVVVFDGGAFVVEGVAIGFDVVEEDVVGFAAFGEDQDGGGDAGVGFEDAAGEFDDAFELVVFEQGFAQGLVGVAGAEQHAVGHDHGAAAADAQHAQDEGNEEQLGFFGFDHAGQRGVHVFFVEAAFEGRVGE